MAGGAGVVGREGIRLHLTVAGPVSAVGALRHDPLEVHHTRLSEDDRAVAANAVDVAEAGPYIFQEPGQPVL